MICPKCECELTYKEIDVSAPSMEIRNYICPKCGAFYERYIGRSRYGLIRHDALYETDKDGNYGERWE